MNLLWVQQYADIWPGAIPVISSASTSDDESVESSSDDDADEDDVDSDADQKISGPAGNRDQEPCPGLFRKLGSHKFLVPG